MSGLPDPSASRAVLIGTSHYINAALDDLPPVAANLEALAELLRSPDVWRLPARNCVVVPNPSNIEEMLDPIRQAATEATDTLLVYYAGHGLQEPQTGELLLTLTGSKPDVAYTSVLYSYIRGELVNSRRHAERQVVILDCCFSGRALEGGLASSGAPAEVLADDAETAGTFLITAAGATKKALFVPGEPYTAFTAELLDALSRGVPGEGPHFDLDALYLHIRKSLMAKRLPEPQKRVKNTAGRLRFPNPAFKDNPESPLTAHTGTLPTAADSTALLLQAVIESSPEARSAQLTSAAQGSVTDVITLAGLLPRTGIAGLLPRTGMGGSHLLSEFLRQAAADRPLQEIVELISGVRTNEQFGDQLARLILTAVATHPVPDIVELVRELPADDRDILISDVSRSSSVERVVELARVLRARGLTRDADAVLRAAALRAKDLVALFSALGKQDRTAEIEFLLASPQTWNWSWQLRHSIAAVLKETSLSREAWRPLLRRHAAYMPKSQSREFALTFGIFILLTIAFHAVHDNVDGPAKAVVALSGAIAFCVFGFCAMYRIVWTNLGYSAVFFGITCGTASSVLPISGLLRNMVTTSLIILFVGGALFFGRQAPYLRAWCRKAIARHRLNAPAAMYCLADLETREGNADAAQEWYTRAIAADSNLAARWSWGMRDLGYLKEQQGDLGAARHWYAKAAATENTQTAAQAMLDLGRLETQKTSLGLLHRANNLDAARDWYTRAIATERPYIAIIALIESVLPTDGRLTATVQRLHAKAAAGKAHAAPWAMYELGRLEHRLQNHSAARDWFTKAAATRNAEAASKAADALALLKL